MDSITHSLITTAQIAVLCLVVVLLLVGVWCWFCSYRGIRMEKGVLSELNSFLRVVVSSSCKKSCIDKAKSLEKEKSFIFPNHLGLRIKTLEQVAKKNEDAEHDKKGQIKRAVIPDLTDMHELTLHNETGRFCTATMNTIISCLLICGILGTLLGVHIVIKEVQTDGISAIGELPKALMPSMLAVGFTIVLIILRGIYLAQVEQYVSQLDRFTLERLLPIFTPRKEELQRSASELQELSEKISELEQDAQTIQRESNVLKKRMNGLDVITSSTKALLDNNSRNTIPRSEKPPTPPEHSEPVAADSTALQRMHEMTHRLENELNEVQQMMHAPTLS